MSCRMNSKSGFLSRRSMFASDEVTKLSMQITRDSLSNRSHRWDPINPAPPVTKIFFLSKTTLSAIAIALGNKVCSCKVGRGEPSPAGHEDVLLIEHDFVGHRYV